MDKPITLKTISGGDPTVRNSLLWLIATSPSIADCEATEFVISGDKMTLRWNNPNRPIRSGESTELLEEVLSAINRLRGKTEPDGIMAIRQMLDRIEKDMYQKGRG